MKGKQGEGTGMVVFAFGEEQESVVPQDTLLL